MSDAIQTKIGFDVGDALGAISRLNTDMKTMATQVTALGQAFSTFNSSAAGTGKIFTDMATGASKAADAMERLAKAKGLLNKNQSGGSGGGGRGNNQSNNAEVQRHIAALQQTYGPAPAEASDTSQRKYQNAITQAAQFAAASKQSVAQVATIGNSLGSSFTGAANTVANKLSSIKQAFASMTKSASQNTNKLTIDFQTFVRIVSTQVVVRALSAIKQGFADAFDGALKFQTQVAEIGTIATKDFGGSAGIAQTVREISDAFNLPLNTSAEGYYETLSNQIGDASKSQEFFTGSAKLAKAGVTSLDNAVNLLSGTLNAYGLDASETDAVSSKYFETVRLGRVRVEDLANTMGRVLPQARQVGVGLDEVLAAIASITISGVKPAESLTQIRGAINALAKPTDDLKAAFRELNITSAEQGVGLYGFGGLLQKLATTTDGTSQAFAKLFPNMRGVNGAIIVGKTQIGQYEQALDAMKKASSGGLIDEKATEVLSSDAQIVEGAIQKIKNALVVDLGGALVKAFSLMEQYGSASSVIVEGTKAIAPVVTAAAVALGVYAGELLVVKTASIALTGALAPLHAAILAIGAGVAIGTAFNKISDYYYNKPHNDLVDKDAQQTEFAKKAQDLQTANAQEMFDEINRAAKNNLNVLNGIYLQNVSNAKAADDKELASVKNTLNSMLSAREQYVAKLRSQAGTAYQAQVESQGRVAETQMKREQAIFDLRTKNLNPRQQAFALRDRAADLTSRASRTLASAAGNPEQLQQALRMFDQAESAAQQFGEKASESGALQRQAQEAILGVLNKRIAAEKQLSALEASRQKALTGEANRQQKNLSDAKKAIQTVLENTSNFDKANNRPFTQSELADRAKKRNDALAYLQKTALTSKDFSLADSLGLGKFVSQFHDQLSGMAPLEVKFDIEKGAKQFQEMLNDGLASSSATNNILAKLSGKAVNNPNEAANQFLELEAEQKRLNSQIGAAEKNRLDQAHETTSLQDYSNRLGQLAGAGSYGLSKDLQELIPLIQKVAANPNASREKLENARQQFVKVRDANTLPNPFGEGRLAIGGPFRTGNTQMRALQTIDQMFGNLQNRRNLQDQAAGNPAIANSRGVSQRLQQLTQGLGSLRSTTSNLATSSRTAAEGLGNVGTAAQDAAEKLSNISVPQAASAQAHATGGLIKALNNSTKHLWTGGMAYYASGGQPRGTDRVPAMLAPGEFITNARATRNFLPQLQAMNAGMEPNYRSNGGHTTNVGDVTVNVNGAKQGHQEIARAVAGEIKRLGRRGVI